MAPGIVKLFATVLALIGPAPADSPKEFQLQSGQKIVAIGDSITGEGSNRDTGFVRVIDAVLAKQYPGMKLPKVINAGMGGQRSEHLVPRFDKDVVQHKPAYVIIAIGINDEWQHLWDANRKPLPADEKYLTEYKKNVTTMVDAAQKAGIKVILVTPTFIGEDVTTEANKRLLPYVEAERQIAAEKKCQLIDMHAIFLTALQRTGAAAALARLADVDLHTKLRMVLKQELPADKRTWWLTVDGAHMNPLGDAIMAVAILRALGVPDEKIAASVPATTTGKK